MAKESWSLWRIKFIVLNRIDLTEKVRFGQKLHFKQR